MGESQVNAKFEKLSARNYTTWKILMSSLSKSKGLDKYIGTQIKVDEDTKSRHEEAKFLMYSAMESQQIMATGSCDSAGDLWAKIKENNEGAEKDLRNNLLAEFLGFKYRKDETIIQYCGRFEILLGRLLTTGHKVDDSTKMWVFRNTLPKEFKDTVNVWSMASGGDVDLSQLITQLKIQHHMDRDDKKEGSIAAFYSGENKNSDARQNDTRRSSCELICNYCKVKGHKWRDCRKKKSDDERKKKFSNKSKSM